MRRLVLSLSMAVALALVGAVPASAAFGLKELDVTFTNEDGSMASQAGAHPFAFETQLFVNSTVDGDGFEVPEGEVKDLVVAQIPGLVGNPTAVPPCSLANFNTRVEGRPLCPDSTAIGVAAVKGEFEPIFKPGEDFFVHAPVYNLVPSPGSPAKFGFVALNVPVVIDAKVNDEPPYNVVAHVRNISQAILFYGARLTLWGNPADPAHNTLRGDCVGDITVPTAEPISLGSCPVDLEEKPFLTLPRACAGPLPTDFTANSWLERDVVVTSRVETHDDSTPPAPQGMTGCEKLGFSPEVDVQPTTAAAESPGGLDVSLQVKDEGLGDPVGLAQSDIRKVVVTLPKGITANPSAAAGLGVCSLAQYESASVGSPGCPESSKLGTVQVKTPLLEEAIEGSLYLAQPDDPSTPGPGAENPFDSLIGLYVILRHSGYGIVVKQAGKVVPDPQSGQLVSTFEDIPQLPFSSFKLNFREGPRAPLVTPPNCGTYRTEAVLTPWAGGKPVTSTSSFQVVTGPNGGPCPAGGVPPFKPGFQAGSINNNAGSFSPFYMRLTRNDGEQDMTRFDSILPRGVTGKIAGVGRCSDAQIAAAAAKTGRAELASPSCPASSEIGRVLVGAGVGPSLTYVPGKIYLAGPYGGDPLSIVVVTPAVAGPFDVGTVVTREALDLDPNTAEVQVDGAASDPIPHILEGIPLKLRDLRVYIDRPNFTLNPTGCEERRVRATLFGSFADPFNPADDVPAALSARYQASNCSSLSFKPKLALALKGGTRRSQNPAFKAVLTTRAGDANVKGAEVILPPSQFIDNAHIGTPCTRPQFAAGACPPASVLGNARAFTPLLDTPLEGPVYFLSNGGARKLPDVVAALGGQFRFNLVIGILKSKNASIRTKVLNAPDAPVTKFVLNMAGGKKGLLENSSNLCREEQRAELNLTGQNGRQYKTQPVVKTSCKKKGSGSTKGR